MVLLIDNYDSFTYNLAHGLREAGADIQVARNDALTVADALALTPAALVVSPGPGRPEDAGSTVELIRALHGRVPILGVCLGHQAISIAFGGRVARACRLMHGKASPVRHDGSRLFQGIADPMRAGRYHSLVIPPDGVPAGFRCTAHALDDNTVMAIEHERLPVFGVQFHPESVLTPDGQRLLRNFLSLT